MNELIYSLLYCPCGVWNVARTPVSPYLFRLILLVGYQPTPFFLHYPVFVSQLRIIYQARVYFLLKYPSTEPVSSEPLSTWQLLE